MPRCLRHQMLVLLSAITAVALVLLYALSSHRLDEAAMGNSRQWAESVARTAASASADKLARRDLAALEATLRDLASLPGVLRIDAVGADGRPVLALAYNEQGRIVTQEPLAPAASGQDRELVRAWAPVGAGGGLGSVGVSFSPDAERAQIRGLQYDALVAIAAVGLFTIAASHALLLRGFIPLQRVVRFSRSLAQHTGAQLERQHASREVDELTDALNDASRTLKAQLDAISASERRTHMIFNAVPDAIIGVDADGIIRSASPAVSNLFGRESADLIGVALAELLPGLDAAEAERRTLEGMYLRNRGTHVARFEAQALRHGGTHFPVEVSLARMDSDGAPGSMRYACAVRDVTDQRMLDSMLRLYSRALECSSNGVVISDLSLPGGPMIYANAAFERITGYPAAHAIGRNCAFLQRGDTAQPELAQLREAIAAGAGATVVLRNYRQDGSLFFNELSIAPVAEEGAAPRYYVGILNDVTERERARLAIAERTARLNAIFDLSPDGFVVFDREGQLAYSNQAFMAMTGWDAYTLSEGLSVELFEHRLASLCAHDPDGPSANGLELLQLARPRPRVLSRLVRHNAGGQGETIHYFRDVTHETEVDRMKSEFLTTAAHELRTPMVSVFGFTELLLKRPVPEGRKRDVLETIHRQASLLITMINDLLDLARIEARQGRDLQFTRVRVADLVRDTVERIGGAAGGHTLRVSLDPLHAEQMLQLDTAKASQALTNVLANAFKYSAPGSVVELGSRRAEGRVGLVVADQGIGMTPEQLARVFERFYRADPSGNVPGTGLGMCLVKEIVELQGGTVEIASQPGQGTTVTLWWPLVADPHAAAPAARARLGAPQPAADPSH